MNKIKAGSKNLIQMRKHFVQNAVETELGRLSMVSSEDLKLPHIRRVPSNDVVGSSFY